MKTPKLLIAVLFSIFCFLLCASAQTRNPIIDFLDPTNTFLTAQEINLTLDSGWQANRKESVGGGLRYWISDSQGASVSYESFPDGGNSEWQIAYGYRTAYGQIELDSFVGLAQSVGQSQLLMRPYVELDVMYQITKQFSAGFKTQITDNEKPFAGLICTYKFVKGK